MKKITILLCIVSASFFLNAQEDFSPTSDMDYIEVSSDVVLLESKKLYGSDIVCAALNEGLVFIDCGLFTSRAKKFRSDMEEKYGKKTLALFLTHAHIDHFFGMGAFNDVSVISSYASEAMFSQQLQIDFSKYVANYEGVFPKFGDALKEANLFLPNMWFDKEMTLGTANDKLILKNTGGHTICSSYAYYIKDSVIMGGDNLQAEYYPYFGDPSGNMESWIETLKEWESLPVKHFCPGHGPSVDIEYITSTRIYFEEFYNSLIELKRINTPIEEVIAYDKFPEGYWPEELERPGWFNYSIGVVYKSITLEEN